VVTGAASGIGRALCPLLGREGARLVLIDRNAEGLGSLSAELTAAGIPNTTAVVDVTDRDALRAAIGAATARFGPVDLLVACAGITGVTLVDGLAADEVERLMRVNFLGVVYAIDAVLPGMIARRRGQIVGISSLAGCRGMPFSAAYSASKAALSRYLEGLRPSLRGRGISVTTVCPGFVRTPLMENAPLQPPLRMMEPEAAARYVLRAIVRRWRFYCFPWTMAMAVRVLTWLPAQVYDWSMARAARKVPNLSY
jgi:short-subunit dehydrogenase